MDHPKIQALVSTFQYFISNGEEVEGTLIKLTDYTKLSGLANTLADRNEISENNRVTFNMKSSSVRKQKSEAQLHDGE